jgi:hypothetical protein
MNRKKKQKNFSVIEGGFFRLPHQVSGSIAYRSLSSHAAKLLIDLGSYFRGNNNGDLSASFKVLKKERGWKSSATLDRAKKELIKYGLIVKTRQGGKNKCCLYGFTFFKLNKECSLKMDIPPTESPTNNWKRFEPLPNIEESQARVKNRAGVELVKGIMDYAKNYAN